MGYSKLKEKNLDIIAINDVSGGKGFYSDYNELHVLTKDGKVFHLDFAQKSSIAFQLLSIISRLELTS